MPQVQGSCGGHVLCCGAPGNVRERVCAMGSQAAQGNGAVGKKHIS